MMEPKLVDWLDEVPADQAVSVIVHMAEQAPIAQLDVELRAMRATRQHRHQVGPGSFGSPALQVADSALVSIRVRVGRGRNSN